MISPATKTVYYNFDYSPRRGFGFFNCASFTLTKLAVAGLSSKGLSSNKNYQKNSFVSTMSLLEASVSVRRYNCMSDEHRIEVDTRIDEIKYHHRVNDYEEICEMVTRYVEAHHALLQEADNSLVRVTMPTDTIKQVLSFL